MVPRSGASHLRSEFRIQRFLMVPRSGASHLRSEFRIQRFLIVLHFKL